MENRNTIKSTVKEKYGAIAKSTGSCCGCGCEPDLEIFSKSYENESGYVPDADLGLGCGIPTRHIEFENGMTVVDLGSGAGNDAFVARSLVGKEGTVIGIDMTPEMIKKAEANTVKMGYDNVIFKLGDIESLPLNENTTDLVLSNCVLNLVPDKDLAFKEIYRVLKPGGKFCISDIVLEGELSPVLAESAAMYVGCVTGAMQKSDYMNIIKKSGFNNGQIKESRQLELPDELLKKYLSNSELAEFKANPVGIISITITGEK